MSHKSAANAKAAATSPAPRGRAAAKRPAGGRAACRWQATERSLRRDIVEGAWAAGEKLPTYDELEGRYGLSRLMLQQAVRRLKQDGFVIGRERQGLFVSPDCPHQGRLGLVLPQGVGNTRFWREIDKAARAACASAGKTLAVYDDLENSEATLARLVADVEGYMVTGLLVPFPPDALPRLAPALAEAHVPCAVFDAPAAANVLPVALDDRQLAAKGAAWLAGQGARRIAYFGNYRETEGIAPAFAAAAAAAGLEAPAGQRFSLYLENLSVVEKIVGLLLSLPAAERPDGIFIGDDNLVAAVLRGVIARGVRVPDELKIASHCNWPADDLGLLPVEYFGYDLRGLVEETLRHFAAFHAGNGLGEALVVPALAAAELPPARRGKK